ncbi:MAG: sigma-70 family RNA polymerase sigma factor [Planctomycetales bacterium]|nr:sigma-70 family RNA polymerase sigma factor [Planctomycetales bacterium]
MADAGVHASSSESTSRSLLARVRKRDGGAWSRFAAIYTPLVYAWARRAGLQETDAADVAQDVFRTVLGKLDDFQRDGRNSRFRGWLWAITRNRVRLFYRQAAQRAAAAGGSSAQAEMNRVPAMLESDDEPSSDVESRAVVRRALESIRGDFSPATWNAFWRVAIDDRPAGEVAQELQLSAQAVRQAKYRVLCRLRDELEGLG